VDVSDVSGVQLAYDLKTVIILFIVFMLRSYDKTYVVHKNIF